MNNDLDIALAKVDDMTLRLVIPAMVEHARLLPTWGHWCYVLLDAWDTAIYVGGTTNVRDRVLHHVRDERFEMEHLLTVVCRSFRTADQMSHDEEMLIRFFRPSFNRDGRGKPYRPHATWQVGQ